MSSTSDAKLRRRGLANEKGGTIVSQMDQVETMSDAVSEEAQDAEETRERVSMGSEVTLTRSLDERMDDAVDLIRSRWTANEVDAFWVQARLRLQPEFRQRAEVEVARKTQLDVDIARARSDHTALLGAHADKEAILESSRALIELLIKTCLLEDPEDRPWRSPDGDRPCYYCYLQQRSYKMASEAIRVAICALMTVAEDDEEGELCLRRQIGSALSIRSLTRTTSIKAERDKRWSGEVILLEERLDLTALQAAMRDEDDL